MRLHLTSVLAIAILIILIGWTLAVALDIEITRLLLATYKLLTPSAVSAPFRPLLLIVAGLWLWSINLLVLYYISLRTGCDLLRPILIDADEESFLSPPVNISLLDADRKSSTTTMTAGPLLMQHQLYTQAVRHMAACSVVCGLVLGLVFVVYEFGLLVPWLAIWTAVLGLAGLLLNPFNFLHRLDRFAFLRSLKRIVFGGVERTKVQFTDVLLADIFTSYARVFGDLWTVISVASFHPQTLRSWNSGKSIAQRQRYAQSWLVSLLISLPYLWRFRQCIAEYRYSPAINHLQLFNALKYASIFPAILVNYLSINWDSDMIFYAGILFALINTLFSLYWDLIHDWGLGKNSLGLRDTLIYRLPFTEVPDDDGDSRQHEDNGDDKPNKHHLLITYYNRRPPWSVCIFYYLAVLLNTAARFGWAIRLHLLANQTIKDQELSAFVVQIVELIRRWLWIFLRVERQWLAVDFHRRRRQLI